MLIDTLMMLADRYYEQAWEGIAVLPLSFGRVMAVAAPVYQGIHRSIRRNGYDNFRRRAYTSLPTKLWLGMQGRWQLVRLKRRNHKTPPSAWVAGFQPPVSPPESKQV